MAFYEGGMSYTELKEMPLSEFFDTVECANEIAAQRKREADRGRHGKYR